jgi:hypothetical protein
MARIYIKHSMQNTNPTPDGKNEMLYAGIVADYVVPILQTQGHTVRLCPDSWTDAQIIPDIKAFKPDLVLDIHSNACGTHTARGTRVLSNQLGYKFGQSLLVIVGALTPAPDGMDVAITTEFFMLRVPFPSCILETIFHDNPDDFNWYIQHLHDVALKIDEAINSYLGVPIQEVDIVKGIIICFGDGDLAGGLLAHYLTGFPITFLQAFNANPVQAGVRVHVGGPVQTNTPQDIYCGGTDRAQSIAAVLKAFKVI